MATVATWNEWVRELKNRLSEYLRYASAGETILITDNGHPVAELVKVRSNPQVDDCDIAPEFWDRATDGTMELPSSRDRSWTTSATQSLSLPRGTAGRLIDEIRQPVFRHGFFGLPILPSMARNST